MRRPLHAPLAACCIAWLLAGCVTPGASSTPNTPNLDDDDAIDDDDAANDDDSIDDDDVADDDDAAADCPPGVICLDAFPITLSGDTRTGVEDFDSYACDPSVDESGPELVYRLDLPAPGFVGVLVETVDGDVDPDVHLLSALDPAACLDRGHHDAQADGVDTLWLVVDTWVDEEGTAYSGEFTLTVGWIEPASGDCSVETSPIDRIGDGGVPLAMPATGPVVLEAHLVTVDDGYGTAGAGPWPATITEGVPEHHATSQGATGFVMHRSQTWAPQESSQFGQAAHYAKLPTQDEGWYVNMMWADRPTAGTRMIVRDPLTGRAVVASAGFETGPGNLDHVGGVPEEVHRYLGSGHLAELELGFAVDQGLPLGPIVCD